MVLRRQIFQLLVHFVRHIQFNRLHLISPISLSRSAGLRTSMPNSRAARRCRSLKDTTKSHPPAIAASKTASSPGSDDRGRHENHIMVLAWNYIAECEIGCTEEI